MLSNLLAPASQNIVDSLLYLEPSDLCKSIDDEHKFLGNKCIKEQVVKVHPISIRSAFACSLLSLIYPPDT